MYSLNSFNVRHSSRNSYVMHRLFLGQFLTHYFSPNNFFSLNLYILSLFHFCNCKFVDFCNYCTKYIVCLQLTSCSLVKNKNACKAFVYVSFSFYLHNYMVMRYNKMCYIFNTSCKPYSWVIIMLSCIFQHVILQQIENKIFCCGCTSSCRNYQL